MKKRVVAAVLAAAMSVGTMPWTVYADEEAKSGRTKVTLSEVAHSIFYAPQYAAIEEGYFLEEGIDLELVTGFGAI